VYQSRNAEDGNFVPFFDAEGVSKSGDRFPLIENGVIKHAYTSKLYAKQFNLVSTGSADGEFDSVPNIGTARLSIKPSAKTMKEILNGQPGIFVMIAFGGDFTPEGSFGTPVQSAFQFDGEKFIGRLPEFKLSGHLNTMFGDGFLGVSNDSLSTLSPMRTIAMKMKVDV
jgi:PmbA protein